MQVFRILTIFILFLSTSANTRAQNRYTDSLYSIVTNHQTANGERIIALSKLASVVRHYDRKEALRLSQKAVDLASGENDARYKVYAYLGRENVYLKMREMEKAGRDLDSSMGYAEKTKDAKAKAWAWYQKGRNLSLEGREKEKLNAMLKALEYIKNENDWELKASIYYGIYGAFATWEDIDKEGQYALLALDAAQKSSNPNNICESWQAIGSAVHDRYLKTGEKDKTLLDSTINAYRRSVSVYLQHEPYMRMIQLVTIPCINLADAYNRHFPISAQTTDSLRYYATLAFNYATKDKDKRLQAAAFGLMNEDAKRNGNFDQAETYLLQALSLFVGDPIPDYEVRSNVYRDLAELAERRKAYSQALEYYKAYHADYKMMFDAEQNNTGKKLEAQYQAKEKEREIIFLKEKESLQRLQKYLYAGVGIALLVVLIFMFRSYHFRLRYSVQRELLLKKEKEESNLLAQIKIEENLVLEAEKRNAELHAQLQEEQLKLKAEEAARLQAEQQAILLQKEILQKEVIAGRLHVEQKNKILKGFREHLNQNKGELNKDVEINRLLRQENHLDNDFEEEVVNLKEIHPDFYRKLQQQADNKLTDLDLKYCSYILLKRNNSEMARLLSVEPKSVRMTKYRLKQKLALEKTDDLEEYIRNLG
jgi:hypothetical protein